MMVDVKETISNAEESNPIPKQRKNAKKTSVKKKKDVDDHTKDLLGVKTKTFDMLSVLDQKKKGLGRLKAKLRGGSDSIQRSFGDILNIETKRLEEYLEKRSDRMLNQQDIKRIRKTLDLCKATATLTEVTEKHLNNTRSTVEKLQQTIKSVEDGLCKQVLAVAATNLEMQRNMARSGITKARAFDYTSTPGGCALDDDPFS